MAPEAPAGPPPEAQTALVREPSKATLRAIETVRPQFLAFRDSYVTLNTTREKLAPIFMRAYNSWAAETGGNFVSFVRLFDASIGAKRDEYRNHPAYQAATYLQRRARDLAMAAAAEEEEPLAAATGVGAEHPATPLDALARFVAMVLPLIAHEDQPKVWQFFEAEFRWTERRVTALREMVEQVKPFATVRTERGQARPQLHLVAPYGTKKTGTQG